MILLSIALIFLYGIPISLGIYVVYRTLKHYGCEKGAKAFRKYSFYALLLGFIVINGVYWWGTNHSVDFIVKERYEVDFSIHEIESFQDQPVDCEIVVKDLTHNSEIHHEFESESSSFQFFVSDKDELWIKGYSTNLVIDMKSGATFHGRSRSEEDFFLIAKIDGDQ